MRRGPLRWDSVGGSDTAGLPFYRPETGSGACWEGQSWPEDGAERLQGLLGAAGTQALQGGSAWAVAALRKVWLLEWTGLCRDSGMLIELQVHGAVGKDVSSELRPHTYISAPW